MSINCQERLSIKLARKDPELCSRSFPQITKELILTTVVLIILLLNSGCKQSRDSNLQPATITAIAREVAATQTASAPTPTSSSTNTPFPTATPTISPSDTPTPSIVVLTEQLTVFDGPGFDFPEVGKLTEGMALDPLGRDQECAWIKVKTPLQSEGWILSGDAWIDKNFDCHSLPVGNYRPLTGTLVSNRFQSIGKGILEIDNGTRQDSLIVLTDLDDIPQIAVYIQADSKHELTGIPDGVYKIFFASGEDWDPEQKMFQTDLNFQEFADVVNYETLPGRSTQWSLTLHPVEGGTAATNRIPDSQFPDLP